MAGYLVLAGTLLVSAAGDSVAHKVVISFSNAELLKQPFAFGSYYETKFVNVPVRGNIKGNTLSFTFYPQNYGLYKIRFGKSIETDFIIAEQETEHDLTFTVRDSTYDATVSGMEDKVYSELNRILRARQIALSSGNESRERISIVDPHYYALKQQAKERGDSVKEAYNVVLDSLRKANPATYTAQVLIPLFTIHTRLSDPALYREYDNHHSYYHRHYFDDMPLKDVRVLNHPAFLGQVGFYMGNFLGEYDEDFRRAGDYMLRLPAAPAVNDFLRLNLLAYLYKEQRMNAVSYLIDTYIEGCSTTSDLTKLTDAILHNPLQIGHPLPHIRLYGYSVLDTFDIPNILLSTPNYVLIFWRSDCSHCREMLSVLRTRRTTPEYRIVTIQLNTDPNPIYDENLLSNRWLNLHCGPDLDKVLTAYKIVKTPGIFLLDSKRVLVKYSNNIADIPIVFRTDKQ